MHFEGKEHELLFITCLNVVTRNMLRNFLWLVLARNQCSVILFQFPSDVHKQCFTGHGHYEGPMVVVANIFVHFIHLHYNCACFLIKKNLTCF